MNIIEKTLKLIKFYSHPFLTGPSDYVLRAFKRQHGNAKDYLVAERYSKRNKFFNLVGLSSADTEKMLDAYEILLFEDALIPSRIAAFNKLITSVNAVLAVVEYFHQQTGLDKKSIATALGDKNFNVLLTMILRRETVKTNDRIKFDELPTFSIIKDWQIDCKIIYNANGIKAFFPEVHRNAK